MYSAATPDVFSLFTNHPKLEDMTAFNQALCGLYAAGLGRGVAAISSEMQAKQTPVSAVATQVDTQKQAVVAQPAAPAIQTPVIPTVTSEVTTSGSTVPSASPNGDKYAELGHYFAGVLDRGWEIYQGQKPAAKTEPVVITGAALGLPGTEHIFEDGNIARLLNGDQFISLIPPEFRRAMLDKNIIRLVKSENGGAVFERIGDVGDVIKLAGRGREFNLEAEFGISAERVAALDRVTQLAIAVGIDAMRDAGIPLVMRYKTTTKGTKLPERWGLPDALRDDTGVIMGSAFPGYDSFAEIISGYWADHARREELAMLEKWSAADGQWTLWSRPGGRKTHRRVARRNRAEAVCL